MNKARLFVRVVELDQGEWELRRGREVVAVAGSCDEALHLARVVAAALVPSAVYVHFADGRVNCERFD